MNHYQNLATIYFYIFEGRQNIYHTWHRVIILLSIIAILWQLFELGIIIKSFDDMYSFNVNIRIIATVALTTLMDWLEGAAKLESARIQISNGKKSLNECRRIALEAITGTSCSNFASIAKECSDLMRLVRDHREYSVMNDFLLGIYNGDSKSRIISIWMTCISFSGAAILRFLPEDTASVFASVFSADFLNKAIDVMTGIFIVFSAISVIRIAIRLKVRDFLFRRAQRTGQFVGDNDALRCFLRDLAIAHRPRHEGNMVESAEAEPNASFSSDETEAALG